MSDRPNYRRFLTFGKVIRFSPRTFVWLIFHALTVSLLVMLCLWQLAAHARVAKRDDAVSAAVMSSARHISERDAPGSEIDPLSKVVVRGQFASEQSLKISTIRAGPGFRVLAPFLVRDSEPNPKSETKPALLWIDLGFVPVGDSANNLPRIVSVTTRAITGIYRAEPRSNLFTPQHDKAANWWAKIDIDAMTSWLISNHKVSFGKKFDGYLHLIPEDSNGSATSNLYHNGSGGDARWRLPKPDLPPTPVARHFGYAVTWGGLALVWIGACLMFVLRSREHETSNNER